MGSYLFPWAAGGILKPVWLDFHWQPCGFGVNFCFGPWQDSDSGSVALAWWSFWLCDPLLPPLASAIIEPPTPTPPQKTVTERFRFLQPHAHNLSWKQDCQRCNNAFIETQGEARLGLLHPTGRCRKGQRKGTHISRTFRLRKGLNKA